MKVDALRQALLAHQAGLLSDAESGYRAVLRREPGHADALYLLALLLHQSRRSAESVAFLARAIERNPIRPEFHNTLGDVHRALGQFDEARTHLMRALELRPGYADAQVNLASTLNASGRKDEALLLLFNAVAAQPAHAVLRHTLAAMLQGVTLHTGNVVVREVLRLLCTDDQISTQSLGGAVLGLTKGTVDFSPLLQSALADSDPFAAPTTALSGFMADALFLTALPRLVITDADMERVLTHIRKWAAHHAMSERNVNAPQLALPIEFLCALAVQCGNTEFAFAVDSTEAEWLARLRDSLEATLALQSVDVRTLESSLARFALYAPLHSLSHGERLLGPLEDAWSEAFRPLVRQVAEYQEEHAIAERLVSLTPIADDVSQHVRAMYEQNPYPRWVAVQRPPATTVDAFIRLRRPELTAPVSNMAVLIAGCGTGQQSTQMALTFPDSAILAFDLSRSSLAYASRMSTQLGISNVRHVQADLLEWDSKGQQFGIVACSGVLHHLRDPMVGWQRLVDALAPDGVMKIGLYSTLARSAVEAARAFVQTAAFPSDDAGIRACRQALLALPSDHPARGVVAFPDFYSLSGCRDLVMHVQERTYTIPQLAACLDDLGLRFLGFQLPQPVQVQFAHEEGVDEMLNLPAWDRFERAHPDTFSGMYQFWCCRR
ncbi:MAG: methyltransferase domain-containing protein [Gemmatimonas sp.]